MSEVAAVGVDVGSTTFKAVVLGAGGALLGSRVEPMHPRIEPQAERVLAALRDEFAAPHNTPVGATGYGRRRVPGATRVVTEITCHARGAFHRLGRAGTLVDIGGQDTKVIRIGAAGEVMDFAMNDKCAAGTGRFLEVILGRLHVPFDEVLAFYAAAHKAVAISSTCTVFAESEVVSLVANGDPIEGIVRGLHVSLASRVGQLAGRLPEGSEVFLSGGVALNAAMVDALALALGRNVTVVDRPQLLGAVGAALMVAR